MKTKYLKRYNTPTELVEILTQRGLHIADKEKASDYIHNIGYFRLSAYFFPLLKDPKTNVVIIFDQFI